ncbi:pyrroline-5-carboxylate reductase [Thalassotalea mangrovi]|uniref:Pyrroline-5-carboxylate reductase n=1 Tax=Thalassotalea mangrovi TaxID=2572245 RepID=A0A4U1BAY3_9GAMM|nr:pyrroline-5-carboxylate reductase [Thalassotalea mangrovi]TKB47705.1 pyrroline-5-carboxylate reductase [Thalassotalea mangrovi]
MNKFKQPKLAFIGGGNMATAIIDGLLKSGYDATKILASAPSKATRHRLAADYNINIAEKNNVAAYFADIIILAVKPQLIPQISREIAFTLRSLGQKTPIVSLAAGTTLAQLSDQFMSWPVALAMPNLPSAVSQGLTGLVANEHCSIRERESMEQVFSLIGKVVWLKDEDQMPAIVAMAGSAPAYFFLFLEAMKQVGTDMGLSQQTAAKAALQSGLGACMMAADSSDDFKTLRERVTSPNGTTEQAINSFKDNNFSKIIEQAMWAAANKAAENRVSTG